MKQHSLIIGGTKGIGRTLVKVLAADGQNAVSVISRSLPELPIEGVDYFAADITDTASLYPALSQIIEKNGKLNSLAFFQRNRSEEDRWNTDIAVSLTATKNTIEFLVEHFDPFQENSIVTINSVLNQFVADEQPVSYHVIKAGLLHMTRYYAVALGSKNIRVNSVSFGVVLKEESKNYYLQNENLYNSYKNVTPLDRMGTAEEIANLVAYLFSPQSTFITGQNITIDGGVGLQSHDSIARNMVIIPK